MKNIILAFLILGLFLISGCASTEKVAEMESIKGVSELELVREMGAPERTYVVGDHKFLTYTSRRTKILRGVQGVAHMMDAPAMMTGAPSRVIHKYCITTFEVAAGHVVDWRAQGNDCPVN